MKKNNNIFEITPQYDNIQDLDRIKVKKFQINEDLKHNKSIKFIVNPINDLINF